MRVPAVSHTSAEVVESGLGSQTARATSTCGSNARGWTTSTTLAVIRNRARMLVSDTTTACTSRDSPALRPGTLALGPARIGMEVARR